MAGLERFHFHAADEPEGARGGVRSEAGDDAGELTSFVSDEAAARFHLSRVLGDDDRPDVRGVTAPERAERVPDLRMVDARVLPGTETTLLRFDQVRGQVPVFGAHAVCEMTGGHGLVSASGRVGDPAGVDPFPTVSQQEALDSVLAFAEAGDQRLEGTEPAQLNFYGDGSGAWHLVWLFERLPVAPRQLLEHAHGHGLGGSPRLRRPLVDYLVDAHTGDVVEYFSATPLLAAQGGPLPVPVRGTGTSEDGAAEAVWGRMAGARFEFSDPQRDIRTHDLDGGDIDGAVLADPFRSDSSDLGDACKGVVSAHVNSTKVYDFYRGVLQRDGIDDAGMDLINVVNVTSAADEPQPLWHNAVWWNGRMWFGRTAGPAAGTFVSFARYLDVIGHELTHGVTEHSANLVYKNESGALNESFSDIFGVMIKNWDGRPEGGDAGEWDWEIGAGLGQDGLPLRDMRDPARTGDPAHMDQYYRGTEDEGGVHTNSNIHNKAAYNVLTAAGADGTRVFTPREAALLYYYALLRLGRMDGFRATLDALADVAASMYAGAPAPQRAAKVAALRDAYGAVGISGD
jgi:Zn-dependent metalloprotease